MDLKDILFIFGSTFILALGVLFKDTRRYYLFLLAAFFPFQTGFIIFYYNGIWIVDSVLFALLIMGITQNKIRFYIPHISLPAIIFLIIAFISAFFAPHSDWAFSEWTKHLRAYLIFIVIYSMVRNTKDIDAMLIALMAGILFQGLLGMYQWRVGQLGLWFLGEPLWRSWRSSGTYAHPSYYSNYLILFLPLAARMVIFAKSWNISKKLLYYSALIFGIIGLFVSFARGPWLAFAFVLSIMAVASILQHKLRPRNKFAVIVGVIFLFLFVYHYSSSILVQFKKGTGRDKSTETRIPLIKVGLNTMRHNLLLGVGLANYEYVSWKYIDVALDSGMDRNNLRQMVHNSFILIGAETGIFGISALILFFIILFKRSYHIIRGKIPFLSNMAFGLSMGLLAIFISLMASPDYHIYQILSAIWVNAGLLLATEKIYYKYMKYEKLQRLKLDLEHRPLPLKNAHEQRNTFL